jgi:hypothetical protein
MAILGRKPQKPCTSCRADLRLRFTRRRLVLGKLETVLRSILRNVRPDGARLTHPAICAKLEALATSVTDLQLQTQAQLEAQQKTIEELSARLSAETRAREGTVAETREAAARIAAGLNAEQQTRFLLERLVTDISASGTPALQSALADMPSPVVSIILPTWNRADIVVDAISSVQAQRFTDWELLIVDDGSSDNTRAAVAPYLSDTRIRYLYQAQTGASAARNRGLAEAKGALVAYIDSDNMWYPGYLNTAVAAFAADPTLDSAYGILVTDSHYLGHTRLLWRPFDREQLLQGNFIDMNVFLHRRALIDRYGNFDVRLTRVNDWDLILRLTEHSPARALPVLAALYRRCDERRVTDTLPVKNEEVIVRGKWYPRDDMKLGLRVLYLIGDGPEADATQITDEIACMRRWGVQVNTCNVASCAATEVPLHEGLSSAFASGRPDLIHIHGLKLAATRLDEIIRVGVPVTVRAHACGFSGDAVRRLLASPLVHRVWIQPHHLRHFELDDGRIRVMPAIFDATSFSPIANKDRRVILVGPQRDHDFVSWDNLVSRMRGYRFVKSNGVSREVLQTAGIYLCLALSRGNGSAAVMAAQPILLQALATGTQIILPDVAEAAEYAHVAATYDRIEDVADIIDRLEARTELEWREALNAGVNYAFYKHADAFALRPLYEDWCSLAA